MQKRIFIIFVFFIFVMSMGLMAQDVSLFWNTFLGSAGSDGDYRIVMDSSGNIYVTGYSDSTWGSPVNAHSGSWDAFVACLDSSGNLLWNTFLGSASFDRGYGIALDSSGNIYVSGYSGATWGSPINPHSGSHDTYVACLDSSGNLLWNTFLGSAGIDGSYGIALDSSGNVYVTGFSNSTWGSPVNAHSGGDDGFVACLDSSGNLLWNTFLGSTGNDVGYGIAIDSLGNIYVTGYSIATWGSPVNAHIGGLDGYVACMDSSGNLLWNTFLGSVNNDYGRSIDIDNSGNIYLTGWSDATWGLPVNAHSGGNDGFVACMDSSGNLLWNTFLGSSGNDHGYSIVLDSPGNVYVTGFSSDTWGSPVNAYSGGNDVFVACMDSSGNLVWNTFLGSASGEVGYGIAIDSLGNIFVTGYSDATWGWPVNAYSGGGDAFVARLSKPPIPDIKANGSDGPISITQSDTLQIKISLNINNITGNADFWLAYKGPSGWYHFDYGSKSWKPGLNVTHQGALFDLNPKTVFRESGLSPGVYRFYFAVDMVMDGTVTKSCLYADMVKVTVTN